MDNDERIDEKNSFGKSALVPRKSYSFLLQLSRKLGTVATKSFVDVRKFLNQEIQLPPSPGRFIANMPYVGRKVGEEGDAGAIQMNARADSVARLKKIVKQSQEVLVAANTVFPVTLFPDTIFLDRTKVTIIRRNFFWSSDVMSIRIEDVLNVSASVGPLFGSLTVASRVMSSVDHFKIDHFWRDDAIYMKHIIQGYIIAQHNNFDTTHLSKDELIKTLKELGRDTNG